ncbi:MAG: hypothetical protein ACREEM_33225 [Blastocatellia bacterium]
MQFNQIITQKKAGRIVRLMLLTTAIVLSAIGALIAEGAKQRDFSGRINVDICRKTADGKWEVIDRIETSANFSASVLQLASGGELKTDHVWNGRTAKGRQASVRLAGAGKSKFNLATGELQLTEMPFEVTMDGKKDRFSVKLTTEQVTTLIGDFSGKRAQITGRTARLAMVGTSVPKKTNLMNVEDIVSRPDKSPGNRAVAGKSASAAEQVAEQRGGGKGGNGPALLDLVEVVVVVKGEGQLTAR